MSAGPTAEERAAIDELLGPPETGWEGGERDAASETRVARGGRAARDRRPLLLPALHALQSRVGWISQGGLNYVCQRLTVPPAEAYGVATFYAMFSVEPRPATVVHVCDDLACRIGGDALCRELERTVGPPGRSYGGWRQRRGSGARASVAASRLPPCWCSGRAMGSPTRHSGRPRRRRSSSSSVAHT